MAEQRFRHGCFTLNNYNDDDLDRIRSLPCEYAIFQQEVGERCDTPHLQGYVEFKNARTLSQWKRLLGTRAHIERRRGTREEARDYCRKDDTRKADTEPEEIGTWVDSAGQGRRTDLEGYHEALKEGKDEQQCLEECGVVVLKYPKIYANYQRIKLQKMKKKIRNVTTYILYGPPGTGKTKFVFDKYLGNLYRLCPPENGGPLWWDAYEGEETILLDDFYGSSMKYSSLLQVLDKYPYKCNVKGTHTWANWNTVYITTNQDPKEWYPNIENKAALWRRVKIINANEQGWEKEFIKSYIN